jgi:hypothetical protein
LLVGKLPPPVSASFGHEAGNRDSIPGHDKFLPLATAFRIREKFWFASRAEITADMEEAGGSKSLFLVASQSPYRIEPGP